MTRSKPLLYIIILICLHACSNYQNEKAAQKLYSETIEHLQEVSIRQNSLIELSEAYRNAQVKIETILSEYPSSDLAEQMKSGKLKILDLPLRQFNELEKTIDILTKAEREPLFYSYLVAQYHKENLFHKPDSLINVAINFSKIGQKEIAFRIVKQTINTFTNYFENEPELMYSVANIYVEAGELSQAFEISKKLSETEQDKVLVKIARKYVEVGEVDRAFDIANNLVKWGKNTVWTDIAVSYAKVGKTIQAYQIIETIDSLSQKARATAYIGKYFADLENMDDALNTLHESLSIAYNINDAFSRINTIVTISRVYADLDQKEKAIDLLDEALDILKNPINHFDIDPLTSEFYTAKESTRIATSYIDLGEYKKAMKLFYLIESTSDYLHDQFRYEYLITIASKFCEINEKQKATQLLTEPLKIALEPLPKLLEKMEWGRRRLLIIGRGYAVLENFDQALAMAQKNDDNDKIAEALADIAVIYHERNLYPSDVENMKFRQIVNSTKNGKLLW